MAVVTDPIRLVSPTFPRTTLDRILREARPYDETGHFLYPADENGIHTKGFFAFEPVARSTDFVDAIADDVAKWAGRASIDVDVVFAPASPAVRPFAEAVGARLGRPRAYWEYLPSGRFGNRLVEGSVPRGSTALAMNAVSLQGRCVGLRLPQFVQGLGGQVTAAAVFAKGTGILVRETEEWLGDRFYGTIRVDVPIFPSSDCPLCKSSGAPPVSWREFAEAPR
jgi:hypothetical protein